MNWIKSILLTMLLVLAFTWPSQAQKLKLAEGYLTDSGKPLVNQTLLLEGEKERRWFDFVRAEGTKIKVNALTDEKGFLRRFATRRIYAQAGARGSRTNSAQDV